MCDNSQNTTAKRNLCRNNVHALANRRIGPTGKAIPVEIRLMSQM